MKEKIFDEYSLNDFEDSALMILQFASIEFKKRDNDFAVKMT